MTTDTRVCRHCGEEKTVDTFIKDGRNRRTCKPCKNKRQRQTRLLRMARHNDQPGATEVARVCRVCGVEKPIEQYRFHDSRTRVTACSRCLNRQQTAYRKRMAKLDAERALHPPDECDKDDSPAVLTPIQKPWDLTCHMCGALRYLLLTTEDARRYKLYIDVYRIGCERCGGWLLLEPGLQAFDDPTRRGRVAA